VGGDEYVVIIGGREGVPFFCACGKGRIDIVEI